MAMEFRKVSMRNEDGTQWACIEHGMICWSEDFRDASKISKEVFAVIESTVEESKVRDCPDNGFFGIYNLAWQPLKK